MATDTIRTLLAHAFPGADSALDHRTGGDHLQVAAVSGAFDGRWLGLRPHRKWPIHKRSEQAPQRCCDHWGRGWPPEGGDSLRSFLRLGTICAGWIQFSSSDAMISTPRLDCLRVLPTVGRLIEV